MDVVISLFITGVWLRAVFHLGKLNVSYETIQNIPNISGPLWSVKGLKGIVVNQTLSSFHIKLRLQSL